MNLIGPSHHLFYNALRSKWTWLNHLANQLDKIAAPSWHEARRKLEGESQHVILNLHRNKTLLAVLDDTPVDSFLTNLDQGLTAFSEKFFHEIPQHTRNLAISSNWLDELEEVSFMWGKSLAQELLITQKSLNIPPQSVRGVFELFHCVLEGGEFSWKSLLIRRLTGTELEYELRKCPHRQVTTASGGADLACRLEAMVYRGFALALVPQARFERQTRPQYCFDRLKLEISARNSQELLS